MSIPIEPKEIEIFGKKFILSLMPATPAMKFVEEMGCGIPQILLSGDNRIESLRNKLLSYVFVQKEGISYPVPLNSESMIDTHLPPRAMAISKLIKEQFLYNFQDFINELNLNSSGDSTQSFGPRGIATFLTSLVQFSGKNRQPSTS